MAGFTAAVLAAGSATDALGQQAGGAAPDAPPLRDGFHFSIGIGGGADGAGRAPGSPLSNPT